jgi:hypothetical protein
MNPGQRGRSTRWASLYRKLGVVGLAVAALLAVFQYALQPVARRLDFLAEPQRYTEFYFLDAGGLPATATAGQLVQFGFVIVNEQGTAWRYHWSASLRVGARSTTVAGGTVVLSSGKRGAIRVRLRWTAHDAAGLVTVLINKPREAIDLHLRSP